MKRSLLPFLFCAATLLANDAAPGELGNFDGLLMTGATQSQAVAIEGGALSDCKRGTGEDIENADVPAGKNITVCKVEGGRMVVAAGGDGLVFTFEKVAVLESETNHYYYGGVRALRIGNKDVNQRISATVNVDPKTPDRVWGFLQLNENGLRSAFEAYRRN